MIHTEYLGSNFIFISSCTVFTAELFSSSYFFNGIASYFNLNLVLYILSWEISFVCVRLLLGKLFCFRFSYFQKFKIS